MAERSIHWLFGLGCERSWVQFLEQLFADFPGIDEICATFIMSREIGLRWPIAKSLAAING